MPIPPRPYRDLRFAFERCDYREVLATGEATVRALEQDDRRRQFLPAAMTLVGGALLSVEHYRDGATWLERGLASMPGTSSEHELRGAAWFHRALADCYLLLGRWDRAAAYADWLARPEQPADSRLAGLRGQLYLAAVAGRLDDATFLTNAAADLARRMRGEITEAVVEADRALVLAAAGRLHEAVAAADGVAPRLAAVGRDDRQRWANQQATVLLTSLARALAEAGDLMTAERYLLEAAVPATHARRSYAAAQLQLARSVVWREEGDLGRAAAPARDAVDQFTALDTLPALAVARIAEARLAEAQGHAIAARALYERAGAEVAALGMAREHRTVLDRLHRLGSAHGSPT